MTSPTLSQTALVVIAHGSRRDSANQEFMQLVENLATDKAAQFARVAPAFLEQTSPTLLQACETVIKDGMKKIYVYPLFFNNGRHVGKDIPAQVVEAMEAFPGVEIELMDYFGLAPELGSTIGNHITDQL
ncbi:sirohydrochlorin chelatase [Candidatus Pelagadaptatus aseana]|uniref:sirohydrochlorin chelatase n=1 Tax=Candidatus Pelagadaptatus aseana TaxID=3120508 RepID=UPI003C6F8404